MKQVQRNLRNLQVDYLSWCIGSHRVENVRCGIFPEGRVRLYFMNKVICNFAQFSDVLFIYTEHHKRLNLNV